MTDAGRYYEASLTFWAATIEDADEVLDRVTTAYCQGEGEGDDHECKNPNWVASLNLVARDHTHRASAVVGAEDTGPEGNSDA